MSPMDNNKQKVYMNKLIQLFPELQVRSWRSMFHNWLHSDYGGMLPVPTFEEFQAAYLEFRDIYRDQIPQ